MMMKDVRIAMAVHDDKYNEYYDEYNETTAALLRGSG